MCLLPTYHRHLGLAGPAASAIQPPEDLRRQLAQQGQDIVDTVTDGNCGLDAFGLGLASVASRNQVLYNTSAYKAFLKAKTKNQQAMIDHLRRECIDEDEGYDIMGGR